MKKWFLCAVVFLLCAPFASAQFVAVSASVKDSNGNVYAGCRGDATFVPNPSGTTQPLLGGSVFPTDVVIAQCDAFGGFTLNLADVAQVTPSGGTWKFNLRASDGTHGFSYTAPICPNAGCVTGSSLNITSAIQTVAPLLSPLSNPLLNCTPTSVVFSATETFDASSFCLFQLTLTGNVTSSTIINPVSGRVIQFEITQNGTGGNTFAWPASVLSPPAVCSAANCTSRIELRYNGTNWVNPSDTVSNLTVSGTATLKNLNGQQFADQYSTTSAVGNPAGLANIAGSASGGTVAAGTYACEVTYNGATSGETLPSTTSGTIVMSGGVNQLSCAPSDVQTGNTPAGALTYNVYWQTGGAGSFWKGHSSVSLTTTDIQTATPAISGTNPPGSNTAVGILPTAQTALGGNPGTLVIPTTEPAGSGWPGTPLTGQTFWDQRNGVFFSDTKNSIPNWIASNDTTLFTNNQANPILALNLNGINFNQQYHAAHFGSNFQFFANTPVLAAGVKTISGATIGEVDAAFFTVDTFNAGQGFGGSNTIGVGVQNRCHATNCHIWGMNPLVQEESGFRPEYANTIEADFNNNSGTDATSGQVTVEDGIDIISGGTNHPRNGLTVESNASVDSWQVAGAFLGFHTTGVDIANGDSGSVAFQIIPPDNTAATEVAGRNAANTANSWLIQNAGNATFGIIHSNFWFESNTLNIAGSGILRLASTDTIAWRNNANSADALLAKNTSDQLTFPANGAAADIGLTGNSAGTHSDSGFYQTAGASGCTTAASIGGVCATAITITWPVAFADANYKVTCTPIGPATNLPSNPYVVTPIAAIGVTINYFAITAAAASWPTVNCTGVHN